MRGILEPSTNGYSTGAGSSRASEVPSCERSFPKAVDRQRGGPRQRGGSGAGRRGRGGGPGRRAFHAHVSTRHRLLPPMTAPLNRRELLAGLLASAGRHACRRLPRLRTARWRCARRPAEREAARAGDDLERNDLHHRAAAPDGYPDYVAALNQRCSRGVTPENNAAVLAWKAVGPKPVEQQRRKQYFAMLGIARAAGEGRVFRRSLRSHHRRDQGGKPRF